MVTQKIPLLSSPAIASYNYIDVEDGTGVVVFFPGDLSGLNLLSRAVFYSNTGFTQVGDTEKTAVFDLEFNLAKTLKGKGLCSVPVAFDNNAGGSSSKTAMVQMETYHVDRNDVETFILSGIVPFTWNSVSNGAQAYDIVSLSMNFQEDHFGEGEKFRLKIINKGVGQANELVTIGHDPRSRLDIGNDVNGSVVAWPHTSASELHLPFKLDL